MNGFPWLTIAGAVPLLGAIVVWCIPGRRAASADTADTPDTPDGATAAGRGRDVLAKWLALAFSLVTLVVVIIIAVRFQVGGPNYQFTEVYSWIPQFGVHYALGVDGIVNSIAALVGGTSGRVRKLQTGFVRSYALSMFFGAAVLITLLLVVRL